MKENITKYMRKSIIIGLHSYAWQMQYITHNPLKKIAWIAIFFAYIAKKQYLCRSFYKTGINK